MSSLAHSGNSRACNAPGAAVCCVSRHQWQSPHRGGGSPPGRVRILSTPCRGPAVSGFTWHPRPAPPGCPAQLSCPGDGVCSPHAASPGPARAAWSPRPDAGVVPSPMESVIPAGEQSSCRTTSSVKQPQHPHESWSSDLDRQNILFHGVKNIWCLCGLLWKQSWLGLHTEHFRRGGNLVQTLSV